MNYRIVFHTIGNLLKVEAGLLLIPIFVSLIYKENNLLAFSIPLMISAIIGLLLTIRKKEKQTIYAKEGLAIVGLSWIIMSLIGALPFIISGSIPNFVDAIFESVSGFSTTGASILNDVESLSKGILFWRIFTHWIGGMGVLVFILAILPKSEGRGIHIMKAESPGPSVDKLVSKVKITAIILYSIYIALTLLEIIILLILKMPLYDSIVHSLATAGTGGFSIYNDSIAHYNSLGIEITLSIFMIVFGINFTLYYLILIGKFRQAIKSEELRWYLGIVIVSITLITLNTYINNVFNTVGEALRYSTFSVSSTISTTGFITSDYNLWPSFSKWIIIILMFIGASAGSTAGGMKISRLIIYVKSVGKEIKYSLHPRLASTINIDNKPIDSATLKGTGAYLMAYILILIFGTLIISLDNFSFATNFTAVLSCLNNVGPGLELVGPTGNYSLFSDTSKILLSLIMLAGRLEIYPILILFSPKMWKRF